MGTHEKTFLGDFKTDFSLNITPYTLSSGSGTGDQYFCTFVLTKLFVSADCAEPNCSGKGYCVGGQCVCRRGWLPPDCSQVPEPTYLVYFLHPDHVSFMGQ